MITYKNVKFRFDTALWASVCRIAVEKHGLYDISEMIDVDEVTIKSWMKSYYKGDFPHPSMNKFLNLCGLLDIDPGQFFTIQDA